MSVSNGKIIAPVSIEDVKTILGESSNDLATLCKSENINIWSKYKPISCKGDFKEYPIREDSEETVTSSYSYYNCVVSCGMNIPMDTYRNLYNNYGGEGFAINACENLYKDNVSRAFKVHRLVAEAFIPNPENYSDVNHKNEIKDDKSYYNNNSHPTLSRYNNNNTFRDE